MPPTLTGGVPESLPRFPNLAAFDVSGNRMEGSIGVLGLCSGLRHVHVDRNLFSGSLPEGLVQSDALLSFSVEKNLFSGDLGAGVPGSAKYYDVRDQVVAMEAAVLSAGAEPPRVCAATSIDMKNMDMKGGRSHDQPLLKSETDMQYLAEYREDELDVGE